ncbi:hypothetical protein [Pedobacter namyangjuensis]|uniref:hypothetical protein n=1 Tax=Pedobacter namyangjuensis TaxID=600626 RepID=UPI000DE2D470|nr:hypothetical protein [Pedobacter namyangjuensis]
MANQLTSNAEALRLFFTDDVYLVKDETKNADAKPVTPVSYTQSVATPSVVAEPISSIPLVEKTNAPIAEPRKFAYIGKYLKGVLILVNDKANKVSTAEGNLLLRNLVDAIQFKNDDFAVLNYTNYSDAKLDELKAFFKFDILLSFGVSPQQLGVDYPLNQLSLTADAKMVFTSNLHDLSADKETKKILWTSLQKLK